MGLQHRGNKSVIDFVDGLVPIFYLTFFKDLFCMFKIFSRLTWAFFFFFFFFLHNYIILISVNNWFLLFSAAHPFCEKRVYKNLKNETF